MLPIQGNNFCRWRSQLRGGARDRHTGLDCRRPRERAFALALAHTAVKNNATIKPAMITGIIAEEKYRRFIKTFMTLLKNWRAWRDSNTRPPD